MHRTFTLEYWMDEGSKVGKPKEVPGVFSQGETLQELESNIVDAYRLMMQDRSFVPPASTQTKGLAVK